MTTKPRSFLLNLESSKMKITKSELKKIIRSELQSLSEVKVSSADKKQFHKDAVEIITNMKEDGILDAEKTSHQVVNNALRSIFNAMSAGKSNANYNKLKKYFPKKFNSKLYDNGDKNAMASVWHSQNDAQHDTIFKKAISSELTSEELEQVSEYGWDDLKVGDTVTMKNNKKAKVVKLGGKGFPRNFVKVKPSSGKEEVVNIDDLKESNQVSEGMDKRQAGVLIKQLGGSRFIAMTGAKDFVVGPKGATFKIGRNAKSISHVRIDLENDLYNVEFLLVRGTNIRVKSYFKHVYFDQLRDLFEKETGLRTSL
jgi:hypothetical protein